MKPTMPTWRAALLAAGGAFIGLGLVALIRALILGYGLWGALGALLVGLALVVWALPRAR